MIGPAQNRPEASADTPAGLDPGHAEALLAALAQAHVDLLAALDALDAISGGDRPDQAAYAHARWRLSSARRRRRAVAAEVHAALIAAATPAEAQAIARLRDDDDRRLGASALHVQQWTSERVAADWPGYRAASARMRAASREWIAAERALLMPILQRFACGN